jgi:hypothetical protein
MRGWGRETIYIVLNRSGIKHVEKTATSSDVPANAGESAVIDGASRIPTVTPFLWFDTQAEAGCGGFD